MKKTFVTVSLLALLASCSLAPESVENKAARIHRDVLTVDSHVDTPLDMMRGFDLNERHDHRTDRSSVDYPRMEEGGLDAVFMAAFIGQGDRDVQGNHAAFDRVSEIIDTIRLSLGRDEGKAGLARSPGDAYELEKQGKRILFIGIENGYALGDDLGHIEEFYEKGARYITLCHTKNNDICDSSTDSLEHGGLSDFGKEVVREMNRVGMMVDVSHVSDSSFFNVLEITSAPVIASHSSARAVCDNPRNLDDTMLLALAKNGGVIQVCILSDYVKTLAPYPERDSAREAVRVKFRNFKDLTDEESRLARKEWHAVDSLYPRQLATVAEFVDHIDHIVKVAGIDHVGIGTDFDGGGGLDDLRDASQMGNITLEMVKRGYTKEDIRKVWGGNLMRVMGEVQDQAGYSGKPAGLSQLHHAKGD